MKVRLPRVRWTVLGSTWIRVALAIGAVALGPQYLEDHTTSGGPAVLLLAVLTAVPLLLLPERALWAWALVAAVAVVQPEAVPIDESLPWPPLFTVVAMLVLFVVAVRHRAWTVAFVGAVSMVALATAVNSRGASAANLDGAFAVLVVLLAVGYLIGARRRVGRQLAETEERKSVLEERARIARELHDVVAHHMSMIAVQAETAAYRIPDLPEAGKETLADIAQAARESLTEMRRLLGVLRSDDDTAELAPQPGLPRLDELVARARRTGLTVDVETDGTPRPLPPAVDLSAYRIVQEALSNVVSHAPGAAVTITLRFDPAMLGVRVENGPPPGPRPPAPDGSGHGLLGMRERVGMLAGELTVGPTADGGYLVEAQLPAAREGAKA